MCSRANTLSLSYHTHTHACYATVYFPLHSACFFINQTSTRLSGRGGGIENFVAQTFQSLGFISLLRRGLSVCVCVCLKSHPHLAVKSRRTHTHYPSPLPYKSFVRQCSRIYYAGTGLFNGWSLCRRIATPFFPTPKQDHLFFCCPAPRWKVQFPKCHSIPKAFESKGLTQTPGKGQRKRDKVQRQRKKFKKRRQKRAK